jgi:hypothetical protein
LTQWDVVWLFVTLRGELTFKGNCPARMPGSFRAVFVHHFVKIDRARDLLP